MNVLEPAVTHTVGNEAIPIAEQNTRRRALIIRVESGSIRFGDDSVTGAAGGTHLITGDSVTFGWDEVPHSEIFAIRHSGESNDAKVTVQEISAS